MTDEMNNNSDAAASPLTTAAHDVLLERHRQKEIEGWSVEHDDLHDSGQMARAAACYAVGAKIERRVYSTFRFSQPNFMSLWPWDDQWWKPKDRRRDLVRAAALILAEIERLDRAMATKGTLLRPNPNHSGGPMTRSEPPAEVIENVLRMLRESARWHDEENRPYSAGVERDAIALIESLRASSSLGGIEGVVARPQTACAPDEPLITGKLPWQTMEGPMGYLIKPPHSAGEEDWYLSDDPVDGAESLPLYAFTPTATGLLAALEKIADEQKVYLGHGDYDIRPALTDFEAQNVARAAITAHQKVTGVDPSIRSEPPISSPAGALTAEKADLWRKKPVVVRAWQYDPAKLFPEWLQAAYANETVWFEGDSLAIQTLKGVMLARLGSWIIQGIQDELYPCKPDIFLATYEQDAAVAAEEQDTRNRVEPPSSARERRMEEALQKIRRTPSRPFPDPGAHSWRNWGTAVYRAWQDIQGIASAALSSDGRGREKDNTSNASEGVDPSPPASNRSEL